MAENPTTPTLPKPRRRWFRRALLAMVGLFVMLALLHRWLFFGLVSWWVGQAEKTGHLQITYQLDGSIFTSLELSKVRVRVLEPGPVKKLTLEKLILHYHPWDGWRKGRSAWIESIELRDLDLMLDATSTPLNPRKLRKPSKFSIPFPRMVDLRGVRVRVETLAGLLEVDNGNLTLLPDQAGVLSVGHLVLPKYRTFDHLHGETSYRNRDLILQNLAIAENIMVQRLQIDASKLGEQQLTAQLVAQSFGGNLSADFSLTNMGHANDMTLTVAADKINLEQLTAFFTPRTALSGMIGQLNVRIDGEAGDLATWNGGLDSQLTQPVVQKMAFDSGAVHAVVENGKLRFFDTALLKGGQWITLAGTMQLPGRDAKKHPLLADVSVSANLPDFSTLIPDSSGSATFDATLRASPSQMDARLLSQLTSLGMKDVTMDSAQVTATFSKSSSSTIDWTQPWWENSRLAANISGNALRVSGYEIDHIGAVLNSKNEKAVIESVEMVRGQNSIRSHGTFIFQEQPAGPLPGILDLVLAIEGPALQEFSIDPAEPIIAGQAHGTGTLHWESVQPEARLQVQATDLLHQGVQLGTLAIDAEASAGVARLTNLHLDMPGQSFIQATGEFDLLTKDHYAGQVSARLTDLSQFKPLLGAALVGKPLKGTLELDWNGSGELAARRHEGRLSLHAKDGVYAGVTGIQLRTAGYYTPLQAEFPEVDISTDKGNLKTTLTYLDHVLKIANLKLTQNNELRLAGNIALPLDIEQIANSEKRFPLDAPLAIDLVGKDVQLGGLLVDLGLVPPLTGQVSLDVKGKGTLRNLDALIALKARDLKSEKSKQIQPISGEINIAITSQRANLTGSLREPSIQPIALSGSVPLDLASIISTGSINPKLPIQARASLPPSPLNFLTRHISALRNVEGTLGFDVSMEGTLEKPVFLGGVKANVPTIRFRSNSLPTIRGVGIDLGFRENVLTLNQFKGDLAGGPFSAGGTINLTKFTEPVLDLKMQGRSILLVRNDTVVVRSDLDLTIKGPLTTAEVSGNVGVTDSRFFREIDILPINLPGRPAPVIPDKRPNLSVAILPFRDWKLNIAIKTRDSFRITGNLANGEIVADVNLAGTCLAPTLDGNVQISRLKASLPFSRLNIEYGNIYFSKDLPPLNPILDLRGKSKVRDYDIDAYIWGDLVRPQMLFLSQPPLTQEDILTLLATGVTQSEIAANPQLIAGRAGWLFIQKYYSKIFHRKQSFEQDSLADRIDVAIGNIDPKTGRESASARLRLSDHWQIISDLDLTGGVRVQVRYLLRFK